MKSQLKETIIGVLEELGLAIPDHFSVEEPPNREFGDYATNVALTLASSTDAKPRETALGIARKLAERETVAKAEVAGPGFINIFLKDTVYWSALKEVLAAGDKYGSSEVGKGQSVNVEFVSANPTGPLHVGNARGGPIGEMIARLYEFSGYKVTREFFVNDAGSQVRKFGKTLYYWYDKKTNPDAEFPEGGYPGDYMREYSEEIQEKNKEKLADLSANQQIELFTENGLTLVIQSMKDDCLLLGIDFDVWSTQRAIESSKLLDEVVSKLTKNGSTLEKDGALWLTTPDDPDLQDRETVLVKSDEKKTLTYFVTDIAYHLDKLSRGNNLLVDVWGANHFGHVPRMKAALRSLGFPENKLQIILYQYIRLKKSGKAVSMGKRFGNFVTLREVIESGVTADAYKYFILSQNLNTPFDFDIELAADNSEKNPVFYIKYAHARIASILRKALSSSAISKADDDQLEKSLIGANFSLLTTDQEKALYKTVAGFPELVREITGSYQLQSLPQFAYSLAHLFHDFYDHCQVLTEDKELTKARLALILATQSVLANSLGLMGIEAPEKM